MISYKDTDGLFYAIFKSKRGVFIGFGPTRSEAMRYCRELVFRQEAAA